MDTIGSNLMHVLSLSYIDGRRTFSNNIIEMYRVLGIEAARTILFNELQEVIEDAGEYVNSNHLNYTNLSVFYVTDKIDCTLKYKNKR